jgi:hypothetical protein
MRRRAAKVRHDPLHTYNRYLFMVGSTCWLLASKKTRICSSGSATLRLHLRCFIVCQSAALCFFLQCRAISSCRSQTTRYSRPNSSQRFIKPSLQFPIYGAQGSDSTDACLHQRFIGSSRLHISQPHLYG